MKNDTVNYPILWFEDRVVSVALSRARNSAFSAVACASTGNLANAMRAPIVPNLDKWRHVVNTPVGESR